MAIIASANARWRLSYFQRHVCSCGIMQQAGSLVWRKGVMPAIERPADVFQRLSERAARLNLALVQVIEQLLGSLEPALTAGAEDEPIPPAGSAEALAAVERLANLFADAPIPHLHEALADPMLALANVDLDELPRWVAGWQTSRVDIPPLTYRDLHASRQRREQFRLLVNDSLIVAVMQRERITLLATNDTDFERVPGIDVRMPQP